MTGIGLLGAFLGGLLTLISPCSALLLPSFFAYAFGDRTSALVTRTGVFLLGLLTVLVPLGAGVGVVGAMLTRHRTTVTTIGGIAMIVLGTLIAIGRGFGSRSVTDRIGRLRLGSTLSVYLLGALYGLAGFCSGPLIGGVLTVSFTGGSPAYGALLMAGYALGMVIPLFVLALVWDRWKLSRRRWLRGREVAVGRWTLHSTNLIAGALFIAIGVLFLTTEGTANLGGLTGVDTQFRLQNWINETVAGIDDVTVAFMVALVVLAVLVIRMVVRQRRDQAADETPTESQKG